MSSTADTAAATDAAVRSAAHLSRPTSDSAPASDAAVHTTVHFGRFAADSAPTTDVPYRLILTVVGPISGEVVYGGSAFPVVMKSSAAISGGIDYGGYAIPSSGIAFKRWRFTDPVDGSVYVFEINPNSGGSAKANKITTVVPTTAADGQPLIFEGDADLLNSQFSGMIRSQAQYDAFHDWFDKDRPVLLTDDLGRRSMVNLTRMSFRRAGLARSQWRQQCTVDYQILSQLDV